MEPNAKKTHPLTFSDGLKERLGNRYVFAEPFRRRRPEQLLSSGHNPTAGRSLKLSQSASSLSKRTELRGF